MFGNLFIKTQGNETLDEFARILELCINCGPWTKRNSTNFINEVYYKCACMGTELQLALADESEYPEYTFWLNFRREIPANTDKSFFDSLSDCVARKLTMSGYLVVRPLNYGHVGSKSMFYRRNNDEATKLRDSVIAEESL